MKTKLIFMCRKFIFQWPHGTHHEAMSLKSNGLQMVRFIIALLVTAISFQACDMTKVTESLSPISPAGWAADSASSFEMTVDDIQQQYNLLVMVRHSDEYPFSNLWLFIKCQSPTGKVVNDTIECLMADQQGKWAGRGWGSQYYIHFPYRPNFKFAENGIYHFEIQQGMRTNQLKGIQEIGLRLEKSK